MKKSIIPKAGERVEIASRFVSKTKNLLDVGCGDGIIHYFIKDRVEKIYGIDSSKSELLKAKKRGITVSQINFEQDKFPFKNSFFDTVTCLDVIEHVKDPKMLLIEISRVLKRDGMIILATPNIRFSDHLVKLIFKGVFPKTSDDKTVYDGGHLHFFTFKDLRLLLSGAGFKIVKEEGIINKEKRGWKGRMFEFILGKKIMLEFRAPGILMVAKKL